MLFPTNAKEKNINYSFFIDEKINANLHMDIHKIKQVMSNLISNAIKFTSSDKNINIKVTLKEDLQNKQTILFSILDEGIGIALDKQKTIFEAFSQADNSTTRKFGGTGLGLNISSSIVELLGGELQVESEEEKGSNFFFELQFEKSNKKEQIQMPSNTNITIQNKDLKILVVDDNEINLLLISEILKKLKVTSFSLARNGQIAIDECLEKSFDIILMDINMPILNGIEATNILRKKHNIKTPIIALTANSLEGDKDKFLENGMDDYLSKPFNLEKFIEIINKYS